MRLSTLGLCLSIGILSTLSYQILGGDKPISSSSSSTPFQATRKYPMFKGEKAKEAKARRQIKKEQEGTSSRTLQGTNNGGEWPTEHYDLLNR